MNYLRFIRHNARFLSFGVLLMALSSFGQTFFIAVFNSDLRSAFDLTHGDIGDLFATATVIAGFTMMAVGRKVDDVDLRLFTGIVLLVLAAGCFLMGFAASTTMLAVAFFTVRFAGQGMMMHTAMTSMARYYEQERGTAVSLASLGLTTAQAFFPALAVFLIFELGWRGTWQASGAFILLIVLPGIMGLLADHPKRHRAYLERTHHERQAEAGRHFSRLSLLKDPKFFLIVPLTTSLAFVMTGFIFHGLHLPNTKGWSETMWASTFTGFSLVAVVMTLVVGRLVDVFTARRLLPFYMLPVALGLVVLSLFDAPPTAWVFMLLAGLSMGSALPIGSSVWAELYGARRIGAIRSITAACGTIATALAPSAFGRLIDIGISMEAIAIGCVVYILAVIGGAAFLVYGIRPEGAEAASKPRTAEEVASERESGQI